MSEPAKVRRTGDGAVARKENKKGNLAEAREDNKMGNLGEESTKDNKRGNLQSTMHDVQGESRAGSSQEAELPPAKVRRRCSYKQPG